MFFVRLLFLLIFHEALCRHDWRIYVDVQLHNVINGFELDGLATISSLHQMATAQISCPNLVNDDLARQPGESIATSHHGDAAMMKKKKIVPCGVLESVIPATYSPQAARTWTITCPHELWIQVNVDVCL